MKPVTNTHPIPTVGDPGAFGSIRRFDTHTGIDIYCNDGDLVMAIEDGIVVAIEAFTGSHADSPWWNDTWALLVEGSSGVLVYGEIDILDGVTVGHPVKVGDHIGNIKQVLKKDKGVTPTCMLHFEIHKAGTTKTVWWYHNDPMPESLIDPTEFLNGIY